MAGWDRVGRAHAGTSGGAIDFAYRLQAGRADVYEQGAWKADNLAASGDQLRIAVEGGAVKFYKNGALVFTSATAPHYPLVAVRCLHVRGNPLDVAARGGQAHALRPTLRQQRRFKPQAPHGVHY